MSLRRASRKDSNHTEIVNHFKLNGFSVHDVKILKNCCDIYISKGGMTVAIEIKDGSKCPSQRKLSEGEIKFKEYWQGEYRLIESIHDADNLIEWFDKYNCST
jgi:hypothetical protein